MCGKQLRGLINRVRNYPHLRGKPIVINVAIHRYRP